MKKSAIVETLLAKRGINTSLALNEFLSPNYTTGSHDPYLLADMDQAATRIKTAIDTEESIVVYGDYDIDGLSATALLLDGLSSMGAKVTPYIPDRFEEGYGLNTKALLTLKQAGADLVITVDCGSVSHQPLAAAVAAGLDVIVTDHHNLAETLPPAIAVINPKRSDNHYPFTDLAGVGVAFKLVQALQLKYQLIPPGEEKWLLDLVAFGTVCDVVSLVGENRMLVTFGLKVFAKTRRIGLQALANEAGMDLTKVDSYHFGFVLGPRLNAAGRLEHAKLALELLISKDISRALEIASRLEQLNLERRTQQAEIFSAALKQAANFADDPILVLSDPDWNHGIVGIVAAKIMERFHKPTIIMQELGEITKGSARSLGGFSIVEAMGAADKILIQYGGHHVAAGCSLATTDIAKLRLKLNEYYDKGQFGDLTPELVADLELENFAELNLDTYLALQRLRPFGMGNPKPTFKVNGVKIIEKRAVGQTNSHLKLQLSCGQQIMPGIAFNQGERLAELADVVAVIFELDLNVYRGNSNLQLIVKAII